MGSEPALHNDTNHARDAESSASGRRGVAWRVVISLLFLSFVTAMYLLGPGLPAQAQSSITCGEHDTLLDVLQRKDIGERVAVGVINDGAVLELLATPSGSRWIAVVISTSGMSCLLAFGSDLSARSIPVVIAETPSAAPEM